MFAVPCGAIEMWVISTMFSARCRAIEIPYGRVIFYDVLGPLYANRDMVGQYRDRTEGSFLRCSRSVVGK